MTLISTQSNSKITVTQGHLAAYYSSNKNAKSTRQFCDFVRNKHKEVYPNPTENMLFIESFENEDAELNFNCDPSGRVIYTEKMNRNAGNNKHSISLRTYAAGTYFLILHKKSVNNQEENFSFKIQRKLNNFFNQHQNIKNNETNIQASYCSLSLLTNLCHAFCAIAGTPVI